MTRFTVFAICLLALCAAATGEAGPVRPRIIGVSHLAVYTSDPAAAEHYYTVIVGAGKLPDPENPRGVRYAISPTQFIEVLPLPADAGVDRLDHIAWNTNDAEGMRKYLAAKGWKTPARVERGVDGSRWFQVLDPEGNRVQFVQPPTHPKAVAAHNAVGHHIIHIGLMVHHRAAEDKFYRDLLGFRLYWAGGPTPGKVVYVSEQVPDGHDWVEYMLLDATDMSRSGIPADMTERRLGSMDHFSIGEVSVPDTFKVLTAEGRLPARHDPAPHIGHGDGRYQFNMYDPDGTRLELMNLHPTNPPNPPFTAADPEE